MLANNKDYFNQMQTATHRKIKSEVVIQLKGVSKEIVSDPWYVFLRKIED